MLHFSLKQRHEKLIRQPRETIAPGVLPAPQELQDKHYLRKYGPNATYGQGNH